MPTLLRLLVPSLLLTAACVGWSQSAPAQVNLTGFWKPDCQLPFGVQILPTTRPAPRTEPLASPASAASGTSNASAAAPMTLRYALNFCGPGGCANQQEYRPDSHIVGDPAFVIDSPRQLRIMGANGWNSLVKCSDNPDAGPQTRLR
jgi:hypothetical protein